MREFGSLAVFALVNFFFMPPILAQKESRREPPSGWGGFKFMPCAFAEARPLAFKPPFSDLPSFLCHAGDLAIYDFQFGLIDIFQHWHDNLFTEVTFKCFLSNMRKANVYVNIDFKSHLRCSVAE